LAQLQQQLKLSAVQALSGQPAEVQTAAVAQQQQLLQNPVLRQDLAL
jgi:hypothetical protein